MALGLIIGIIYLFRDFFYWAKWIASVVALQLKKKTQRRRFDLYDFEAIDEPEKLGILVPKEEREIESPFPEEHLQNASDEIVIYGVNSKSETLVVKVSRACNGLSDAWVFLKLADGRLYELEQTFGYQRNFDGKCHSFTCGGLQMYYLTAMRRWRIVYCGMLRESKGNSTEEEKKSVFVKFTFIWTASSDVYDPPYDNDVRATADAMARAKWTSLFPPVQKLAETFNIYYQSGVMNGVVSIEDEPDVEMYFFGERMRYIGKNSYLVGCKFKQLMGVLPETGLIFHLTKASIPNLFHNFYFGFIVHPNGLIYKIEDGVIISNLSGTDASGKNLTAMFKAGKQYELQGNLVSNGVHFRNNLGSEGHVELNGIEFEIDGCKGSGIMISGEIPDLSFRSTQGISTQLPKTRPLTVCFTDDVSHLADLTGGKGSSLGKLTKLSEDMKSEFIVPRGMVVTTVAYKQFLTSEIIEAIDHLKDIAYGNLKGNIHEACKIVASAIERTYLPDNITREIEEKLLKIFDGNINQHRVAVRSSATGEDTEQMSAAGQMDTFLGVQGLKKIFTAVKKCWASQFGYVAVEYKRQNGQVLNSPMAVVIQEMVECDAAGVLFTCDPVTNNPSVTVISGNYGLGESVVSGFEEPDTVVLQKLPNEEVKVKSVRIGLKQRKIVMTDPGTSEENRTVSEDVSEDEKNKCCISEEMAVKLGKLSLKIENYFKSPRDIEWGIKHNSIYILQSRPITTDASISDYEIKHELDGPLRCEGEFFTLCNVGEVMPGAVSPLGIDVLNKYFASVFQKRALKRQETNTFLQAKYFPSGMMPFYNHLMMTVLDLLLRLDDSDSIISQSVMIGVFGRLVDDPEMKSLAKYKRDAPKQGNTGFKLKFFSNLFFSGRGIEKVKEQVFNYQIPAENGRTSKEIFDLMMNSCSHHVEPFFKHIICSEMSSLWNMFIFAILGRAKRGIDNDVYSDFAKLLASSTNVESADVPSGMQRLAQSIVKDIKAEDFKAMSVEEAREWLETSTSLAGCEYREFIKRHGHRCFKELDMYSVPWSTDPKPLIKILQNMSGSCEDVKDKKEENLSNILPHLTIPLNLKSRLLLRFVLPNCRRGIREREYCKSILVKSFDNSKKGFEHLSKAMVAEGYLPDKDLLYFLTIDEIRDVLEMRNPRLIARANHRRKLFPLLDSLSFPEISKGLPVPTNEKQDEEVEYVADLTMKGIPVSQGTVKGYARVALSLEEASHLKPGEILITLVTDIAWSPYFPILAGVVTEIGGLISHGAVVSREYGLPCVVGLHGATKQFVTGDYVLLDGNKGILQRLTPPEK